MFGIDDLLGGVIAGGAQMASTNATNNANREMAQQQMAFQERMSNTSHQREVSDLKAAGLNPILSANGGASAPAGATATMDNGVGSGISTAVSTAKASQQSKTETAQQDLIDVQTDKVDEDAHTSKMQGIKTYWDGQTAANDAQASAHEARAAKAKADHAIAAHTLGKKEAEYDLPYVGIDSQGRRAGKVLQGAASAMQIYGAARGGSRSIRVPSRGGTSRFPGAQSSSALENFDLERAGSNGISVP